MIRQNRLALGLCVLALGWTAAGHSSCPVETGEELHFFTTNGGFDGEDARLPVHGRLTLPEKSSAAWSTRFNQWADHLDLMTSTAQATFQQRAHALLSNTQQGRDVLILWRDKARWVGTTEPNGHFESELVFSTPSVKQDRWVVFKTTTCEADRQWEGRGQLLAATGLSVISSVEDTLCLSHVENQREFLRSALLNPFEDIAGMASLCKEWEKQGAAFHYVSVLPWAMAGELESFLRDKAFPPGSMWMQEFRWERQNTRNLFRDSRGRVLSGVVPLFKSFPRRRFILLGNAAQHDPEIYGELFRLFPRAVTHIYIRRLGKRQDENARFERAFRGVPRDQWTVFSESSELK